MNARYRQRNRMGRMFGCLKGNRAIAIRFDQRANSFRGMRHIAAARCWRAFVHAGWHVPLGYADGNEGT